MWMRLLMNEDDDDKELILLGLLIFHQFLIEGYKNWLSAQFVTPMAQMMIAYKIALASLNVENLGQLTKAELQKLIKTVDAKQIKIWKEYAKTLATNYKRFNLV